MSQNPLQAWLDANGMKKTEFARQVDCSDVHIHRICNDDPRVSPDLAVRIFEQTGVRIGPLRNASEEEAKVFARVLKPVEERSVQ